MPAYPIMRGIGLFVSLVTCAVAVCALPKTLVNRPSSHIPEPEASTELGIESAWPHLRTDLAG
jgi:hypothetical protein